MRDRRTTDVKVGSLTSETVRGAKWAYLSNLSTALLQILFTAILARLLLPQDFGLVTLGYVVINFGLFLAQIGITQALVQRPNLTRDHIRSGFWASTIAGLLFTTGLWFIGPVLAPLFSTPTLGRILQAMGLSFLFGGIGATATALMIREMRFRAIAVVNLISYLVGFGCTGIVMAILEKGAWSLVGAALTQSFLACLISNIVVRPSVVPSIRLRPYREILGFGSLLSLTQIVEFMTNNVDTIIVGRTSGAASLGFYSRALNLTATPMYHLSYGVSQVLFPSLARIQDDPTRIRRAYVSVVSVFATIGVPIALGLSGAARELVLVLLGSKWEPAIPVVRFAGFASGLIALSRIGVILQQATAQLGARLIMRTCQLALFAGVLVFLSRFGLAGYAGAFALSETAFHTALFAWIARTYGIQTMEAWRAYWPGISAGIGILAFTILASYVGNVVGIPAIAILLIDAAAGAALVAWVVLRARRGQIFSTIRDTIGPSVRNARVARLMEWLNSHSAARTQ